MNALSELELDALTEIFNIGVGLASKDCNSAWRMQPA